MLWAGPRGTKPSVRIAGLDLPANVVKEGAFERVDLTLLSVDEQKLPVSLRELRMPDRPPRRDRGARGVPFILAAMSDIAGRPASVAA